MQEISAYELIKQKLHAIPNLRHKGSLFEKISKQFLQEHDSANEYESIDLWYDWKLRGKERDKGIDIVITTSNEEYRIEFEFYKNKNIHILYTQELFEKKGHYEELLSFLKEIKKDKPKDISKSYSGIISSTKQLRKMIFNFDYNAMKKRISEISLKSSSVLNELEKAFLLYHLGQGIQSFETLKINSKQAFRERNYDVWYISLYNMYNIPLFYGYSDENNKKLEKYHEERVSIDLNESFYELPFYKREQLKYLRDIGTTLDTNLIKAYQLKEKALKDLEIWSSSDSSFSFNNNQNKADGIFKKTLLKYFHFLIINENQEKFFQQMTEIFFSFMAIFQIQEKRRDNNKTIPTACLSPQLRSPETVPTAVPVAIPPTMAGMITVVKKAA
ncbi:hypothetical protein HpDR148_05960 [Helicobacter pylori]